MITGFENFIRSMFISFIINTYVKYGTYYGIPSSVRPCTRPTISRVCVDQIKRFLHNIRTGESMTTFHFHRCRIMGLRKKKYVFFFTCLKRSRVNFSIFIVYKTLGVIHVRCPLCRFRVTGSHLTNSHEILCK